VLFILENKLKKWKLILAQTKSLSWLNISIFLRNDFNGSSVGQFCFFRDGLTPFPLTCNGNTEVQEFKNGGEKGERRFNLQERMTLIQVKRPVISLPTIPAPNPSIS